MSSNNLIFVIENDHFQREAIRKHFSNDSKHVFEFFATSDACINEMHRHPMAVIVDYELHSHDLKERSAIKILEKIKELDHHTEVVFFSTIDSAQIAVDCIKHGAFDYIVVNENSYVRLQNVLKNIEKSIYTKTELKKYKLFTFGIMALLLIGSIAVIILYNLGYLQPGRGDLIEP